ncbi:UNVERIFIED_ORG: hypothetical protein M2193_001777 [Bradyrhizobium japonicum]|jgi:hypothetical protein
MNQPLSTAVAARQTPAARIVTLPGTEDGLTELSPDNGSASLGLVGIGFDRLYERCRITGHDRVVGHVSRHNRTGGDDRTRPNGDTSHHECSGTDPGILTDLDCAFVQIELGGVSLRKYLPDLPVALAGIEGMGEIIEDVHIVGDESAVAKTNSQRGPDPGILPYITPGPDFDAAAVSKGQKLSTDDAVGTDRDAIRIPPDIADPRGPHQARVLSEPTCRPSKQLLQSVIYVHLVN